MSTLTHVNQRSVKGSATAALTEIFTTVANTAGSTARAIDTLASSVDMLDEYVQRAKHEQRQRYAAEAVFTEENILEDITETQSQRTVALQKKLDADPEFKKHFQKNLELLKKRLAEKQS